MFHQPRLLGECRPGIATIILPLEGCKGDLEVVDWRLKQPTLYLIDRGFSLPSSTRIVKMLSGITSVSEQSSRAVSMKSFIHTSTSDDLEHTYNN
ncbi:Small ribosomal subunit biogenesis GTPase RsgA [Bienertia sinuspersici]